VDQTIDIVRVFPLPSGETRLSLSGAWGGVALVKPEGSGYTLLDDLPPVFAEDLFSHAQDVGDIDGDGNLDIITGLGEGRVCAYRVVADKLETMAYFKPMEAIYELRTADLDGDGKDEIVVGGNHGPDGNWDLIGIVEYDGEWLRLRYASPRGGLITVTQ